MQSSLRGTEILQSSSSRIPRVWRSSTVVWRRGLQISTPSPDALDIDLPEPVLNTNGATPGLSKIQNSDCVLTAFQDAKFEVIGSPFSLLSVSLTASQNLYTRKGSLVGVGGKAENVHETWLLKGLCTS